MEKEREEKIARGLHVPELQLPTIPYVRPLCSALSLPYIDQLVLRFGQRRC